jgi:hypothetical protein
MNSQQQADNILQLWHLQAKLGIKPKDRRVPVSDDEFHRDLEIIRQCMERS